MGERLRLLGWGALVYLPGAGCVWLVAPTRR